MPRKKKVEEQPEGIAPEISEIIDEETGEAAADQPSLLGDREPLQFEDIELALDKIEEYPTPPIGPVFIESIKEFGVMEPIIVYPNKAPDGKYRIADGRRRAYASWKLGLDTIPARVVTGGDGSPDELNTVTLVTNNQRGPNPVVEFHAIMGLIRSGKDESAIARATGMAVGTIRKRMKLSKLPAVVLDAVEDSRMSIGAAEEAVKLSPSQLDALKTLVADPETDRVTIDDIKDLRNAARAEEAAILPDQLFMDAVLPTIKDAFANELTNLVERYLGPGEFDYTEAISVLKDQIARLERGEDRV